MGTKTVDLRADQKLVRKHILERVKEYPIYVNLGPGEDEDPISLITLGFDFDQTAWVALVFDTRPDAEPDGEWNDFAEDNEVPFDHWLGRPYELRPIKGKKFKVEKGFEDVSRVAKAFGDMLLAAVRSCERELLKLPVTDDCQIFIEHLDGAFGSLEPLVAKEGEGVDDEADGFVDVQQLSVADQNAYWVGELEKHVKGEASALDDLRGEFEGNRLLGGIVAVHRLIATGEAGLTALMEFCLRWSAVSKGNGDVSEHRISYVVPGALMTVSELAVPSPRLKKQLQDVLEVSLKTNGDGSTPLNAARAIHSLFDGYPRPATFRKNRQSDYSDFLS